MAEVTATGIWKNRAFGPITVYVSDSVDLEQEKRDVLEKLRLKAGPNDLWGHVVDQFRGVHDHPEDSRKIAASAGFSQLIYRRANQNAYPIDIV